MEMTSCIKERVMGSAVGEERRKEWVSRRVRVVRGFQALWRFLVLDRDG